MATAEEQIIQMRQQIENLQREKDALVAAQNEQVAQHEGNMPEQGHAPRLDAYRAPKLPQFYKTDPTLWFGQVEATFRNANITVQLTKADTVIAALDADAAAVISNLIHAPDREKPYDKIKERMLATFSASAESKLRQLLKGQFATDGKPSLFLARMRNNNHGAACSDAVLKSIFIESLPVQCRGILVASKLTSLQEIAELADTVVEAMQPARPEIHAVTQPEIHAVTQPEIHAITQPGNQTTLIQIKIRFRLKFLQKPLDISTLNFYWVIVRSSCFHIQQPHFYEKKIYIYGIFHGK